MKKFVNITDDGNEKAIRKGKRVPDDAVNLAWVTSPGLNPEENMAIVDTSSIYSENSIDALEEKKLMYANQMGVLEDWDGNQLIDDEYPIVSDVFSVDEDYSLVPGSEYTKESILGYVHKSRYFHIDYAALTLGTELLTIKNEAVKIVNNKGEDYVDSKGQPRYRIQLTPASESIPGSDTEALYRVYAYVDTALNEELYLKYNMIELDEDHNVIDQQSDHTEILNPQKYFKHIPEEAEVLDPANRKKKQFSTSPINKKEQVVGKPVQSVDGYKVFVPKKAIEDTREFQLFRWRLGCTFTEQYKVDPIRNPKVIRAGVVVTNNRPNSNCPFVFYNLMKSKYNPTGAVFVNPLKSAAGPNYVPVSETKMRDRSYWQVNFDTITDSQLKQFDILIWSVQVPNYQMTPYLSKILTFVSTHKGTLWFDTNNSGRILGLNAVPGMPVNSSTGESKIQPVPFHDGKFGRGMTMKFDNPDDTLANGERYFGGWNMFDNQGTAELYTISPYRRNWNHGGIGNGYVQRLIPEEEEAYSDNWRTVIEAKDETNSSVYRPLVVRHKVNGKDGNLFYSTIGMPDNINYLYRHTDVKRLYYNNGATVTNDPNYQRYIDSHIVEGQFKFFWNVALLAVSQSPLDSSDEQRYSSTWNVYTDWAASWAIDPSEDVLSQQDIRNNDFYYMQESATESLPLWKRKLSGKSVKQLIDEALSKDPAMARKVQGSTRSYFLECTNPRVEVTPTSELTGTTLPYAWTKEKSPPFNVPAELGAHVVRQDNVIGDYTAGNYIHKSYPAKPYSLQVAAHNITTEQHHVAKTGTWTATADITVVKTVGASSTESILNWAEDGAGDISIGGRPWEVNLNVPETMVTWQDGNYYSSKWGPGNLNWPHWGMNQRLTLGSNGEVVGFLHDALNRLFNSPTGKFGPTDTYFGTKTAAAVRAFQETYGARFVDGIVDAETWFLIGNRIMAIFYGSIIAVPEKYEKYYRMPAQYASKFNISNGSKLDAFMKRSSSVDSPPVIWEMFKIEFDDVYDIHGITLTPHVSGDPRSPLPPNTSQDIMFRSLDVRNGTVQMKDYDSRSGKLTYMPYRPKNGKPFYLPFGPYRGNTVIIGIGQDRPSGFGKSRILGVRDIEVHAKGSKGNGRVEVVNTTTTVTGTFDIPTTGELAINLKHNYTGAGKVVDITWTDITTDHADVDGYILDAKKGIAHLISFYIDNLSSANVVKGMPIPGPSGTSMEYYSMNENKVLNPGRETGFISKADGVKLLCTRDKKPFGIPTLAMGTGPYERQTHFTTLTIRPSGTDPSIKYGFYDVLNKEFIQNKNGQAEISYIEYLRRGPQNLYIGMISNYELSEQKELPPATDAPPVPYRWAMPVYGITFRRGSSIQIEKPSPDLDFFDLWSLPIRTGSFIRKVQIPRRSQQIITGFYSAYQGATLEAHYEIAETDRTAWSTIHGRPFRDIKDENPIVEDDRTIKVKQAPIHAVNAPTQNPGLADPLRPVFTVYKRDGLGDAWEELDLTDIEDYNLSTGTIQLREPLASLDPEFVKVSYTTDRPVYYYKGTQDDPLILNPYLTESYSLLERPIYIGLSPRFVKNVTPGVDVGTVIPESVKTSTLSWTTDISSKLDPSSPDYDPFYVQLGIVYVSPAANLDRLAIVDSRRRGGGLSNTAKLEEVQKAIAESKYYWDVSYGAGLPYQAAGYVIVRLPAGLKDYFTKEEITAIIEKNITVGVQFKIEDLDGGEW
jgi:hypothetical protein